MTDCIFCKVARKEVPAHVVYEDAHTLAFLDIHPGNEGHALVIPKKHFENIYSLDGETAAAVFRTTAKVAKAVRDSMGAAGIGVYQNNGKAAGQVVMHLHVHIVPRNEGDEFRFERLHPQPDELAKTAEKVRGAF